MGFPVADQRILRGTSSVLSWQNLDGDGEAAAPAGAVTVGVVNAAGSVVVAAGAATAGSGTAPRTYTLPANLNTTLDLLTATWTDAGDGSTSTTLVEVVGGFYFTVAEARAADPVMSNDDKFPTAAIVECRRQVEEEFEAICGVSFVPRYRRQRLQSDDWGNVLLLDMPRIRTVRSVTWFDTRGNPTAWTDTELEQIVIVDEGSRILSRAWKWFQWGDTVIEYEHGHDRPPAEVKRAALQRLRYLVARPNAGIPDRATSFAIADGGTYGLARSSTYMTGNDDIDAVLGRWSLRVPGVA